MGRVGVITWYSGPNYGTNLQAIALQKVIGKLGYYPELINFVPPEIPQKKRKIISKIKSFIPNQILKMKHVIVENKFGEAISNRDKKLNQAIEENCKLSTFIGNDQEYVEICNFYNMLIFGSDQIWNPNWFHPFYYADYEKIKTPRIAYAPSIGVTKIRDDVIESYKNALNHFSSIAVREDSGVELLNQITGRECTKVVDPTLLLTAHEWDDVFKIRNTKDEYVLFYLLKDNRNHINAVIKFAKENNLKLKIIPYQNDTYLIDGEIFADAGPKEFIELIRNAKYVITDSFHGMVFSIIYKKQFYALTRFDDKSQESQNSRVYQIINEYGLQNRLQLFDTREIVESKPIDYDSAYKILDVQINTSIQYLKDMLKGIKEDE